MVRSITDIFLTETFITSKLLLPASLGHWRRWHHWLYRINKSPSSTRWITTPIAKTLWSTLIRHRSDTKVSDLCQIDVDLRVFVTWEPPAPIKCREMIGDANVFYAFQHKFSTTSVKPWNTTNIDRTGTDGLKYKCFLRFSNCQSFGFSNSYVKDVITSSPCNN